MTKQRVILDAALDGAAIGGTLTADSGDRREFHGWLELNTARGDAQLRLPTTR